jgi:hypothetical protein
MRYRALDNNGDYTFGQREQNFYVNSPAAVGQAVLTGLQLFLGEYFADITLGVDYLGSVVGKQNGSLYDQVVQSQIQSTQGVNGIVNYASSVDSEGRLLGIDASIGTVYGVAVVSAAVSTTGGGYGAGPYGDDYGV